MLNNSLSTLFLLFFTLSSNSHADPWKENKDLINFIRTGQAEQALALINGSQQLGKKRTFVDKSIVLDTKHKDTKHKDTKHKDTKHKDTKHKDTKSEGNSPLTLAIQMGPQMDKVAIALIEKGAQLNSKADSWERALFSTMNDSRIDLVKALIARDDFDKNKIDKQGRSLAFHAARNGQGVILDALIGRGADVNLADQDGDTPVHVAARSGKIPALEILASHGANLGQRNKQGQTPAHSVETALITAPSETALATAENSRIGALTTLKRLGAKLDEPDNDGLTPAHHAAWRLNTADLKFFAENGADLTKTDIQGRTIAHIAAEKSFRSILVFLEDRKINWRQPDARGVTPIQVAAAMGDISALEFFAGKGHLDYDIDGPALANTAAASGRVDVLKFLSKQGIKLEVRHTDGRSPSHHAAMHGKVEVLEFLKDSGVNLNAGDNLGSLPGHFAAQNGQIGVLRYLARQGADLKKPDQSGATPAHYAIENAHADAFTLLLRTGAVSEEAKQLARRSKLSHNPHERAVKAFQNALSTRHNTNLNKQTLEQLKILKANLLEDLKELEKNPNKNTLKIDIIRGLIISINERAQLLEQEKADQQLELTSRKTSSSGSDTGRNSPSSSSETSVTSKTCSICRDEDTSMAEGCGRPNCTSLCQSCQVEHFRRSIRGEQPLDCGTCRQPLTIEALRNLNNSGISQQELVEAIVVQTRAFNMRLLGHLPCPAINCPGTGSAESRHVCTHCDFVGCIRCGKDHPGVGCGPEVIQKHRSEMLSFLRGANKHDADMRPCPFCGKIVNRTDGCNKIDCPECKRTFHWIYGRHADHPDRRPGDFNPVQDFKKDAMHYFQEVFLNPDADESKRILDMLHY
jgi:ankyrin repeat protein